LAKVLPYKPITETMINLMLKGDNADHIDVLFSCFGQAWDTQGTNPMAYKYVKRFYKKVLEVQKIEIPLETLRRYMASPDGTVKVNKLMRRTHVREKDLLMSFPGYDQMRKRHLYEPDLCVFGDDEEVFEFF